MVVCGAYLGFDFFGARQREAQSSGEGPTERWVYGRTALQTSDDMVTMAEVIRLDNGEYRMFYGAAEFSGSSPATSIKMATSSDGVNTYKNNCVERFHR